MKKRRYHWCEGQAQGTVSIDQKVLDLGEPQTEDQQYTNLMDMLINAFGESG